MPLPPWLADPGLTPLWELLHRRLEQRGQDWRGRVTVDVGSERERRALSALLGKPVHTGRLTLDVALLDEIMTNAGGLLAVVVTATGPVVDRRSERRRHQQQREEPVRAAERSLADMPWKREWLAFVRRARPTPQQAHQAGALLSRLLDGQVSVARQDLAAGLFGDAHALDDGTALSAMTLRGLALASGAPSADHARARRELWESVGVRLDTVSATALTLGVAAGATGPRHLIASDLSLVGATGPVLVCENPRVLEAVWEAELPCPVVCTGGNPNLVVLDVLHRLHDGGCDLRYHGDFDWPGLAIAERVIAQVGARPWLMSEQDYLQAPASLRLTGRPVDVSWSPQLSVAMRTRDLAVHEEAVLPVLLRAIGDLVS